MAEGSGGGKPTDFFVGLVDFFSILLPGAMLAFVLYTGVELSDATFPRVMMPEGWIAIAAFALVAYVLGHFVFVVGSLCIDPLYELWRESFRIWSDRGPTNWLARLWWGLESRRRLQEEMSGKSGLRNLIDAGIYLRLWNPGAAAEMDRLEADQKFFRSLITVLLIAWAAFSWDRTSPRWLLAGLLLLLAPIVLVQVLRSAGADWGDEKRKKRLAKMGVEALVVLMIGWAAWFGVTPPFGAPPAAGKVAQAERQALKVGVNGEVSLTANAQGEAAPGPILTMIRTYPRASRAVLLLGLTLSLVRFVQQRLKYTTYIYRAVIVLTTIPGPPNPASH